MISERYWLVKFPKKWSLAKSAAFKVGVFKHLWLLTIISLPCLVDASNAGEGQLEIAVNNGEVPNQVQVLGNGKCLITFIPELAISHFVDIKFNNENVIGK